ncbi:efflux RND transporter permease subunit [Polymorphobacter fuscus]|uniref:AcrB/AcrD/AcrF family protein n=1 Tax=Sandarakinorhabdus fusca TaxID=1439888 RepID=A0A7C9GQA0_9SPHN|nr:efflux RND transporter permease subunit [Polymorphobacter fuscus]KAB7646187.1 efflux RND transporter permease subunit [Polymorphobacter fuscus]MQT17390.1 AcrB/AcrD/AcrF family protein [Polymorphobacter fuscus]NJC10076.1 multidrug efflux pump subunit AcrB [Polymorphobacter fuscus]
MGFIDFAVKRWQITLVAFALLFAIGLSAFLTIPRSVDPHFPSPFVNIIATVPGAEPSDMETTIAKPIEDVLQGLDGIVRVQSRSTDSTAVITAEFSWSGDPERNYDEVVREVNAIRSTLPSALQRLEFQKTRTTEAAVLQFALVSDTASYRRLEKLAKDLRERMNRVPGVRNSRAWAIPTPEVRVAIDSGRLAQLGLPVTAITDALRAGSTDLPPGAVQSGDQRLNVQAGGAFRSVDEVADVPVRAANGTVVRVKDVAGVGWDYEEQPHYARYNGKRAVWVTITQKDGLNVLDIRNSAIAAAQDYRKLLPPDVQLETGFDQSFDIARKLDQLGRDFAIALAIVLITLLPLGWRASLVVMVSVPLSLMIGVAVLATLGFTLNQLAIAGFIIALGLLVDDSIVVTENIARHLRMGEGRQKAALSGTREIAVAVIGCTFVLLFAFLPLAFLPEGAGKFTRSLPVAVLGTVAASLLVSLTIVPFLASRILPANEPEHGNRFLQAIQNGIQRFYAPVLHWSLTRPWRAMAVATVIVVSGFALVPFIGSSLFPPADASYFLVTVTAPEGAAITQTDRAVRLVEQATRGEPDVTQVLANVGRGNPQIFYNQRSFDQRTNIGEVLVNLKQWDPVAGPALVERLRQRFAAGPDAQYVLKVFQNGPPVDAPILVKVVGPDLDVLKRLAGEVEAVMRRVPGTRDVSNPVAVDQPRLELGLDTGKAALLGVQPGAPRRALRLALAGEAAGRLRDREGDSYNVVVRLPLDRRHEVSALDDVYVAASNGAIPLREIATPRLDSAPPRINRERQQRTVSVQSQVADGFLTAKVNTAVYAALKAIELPPGYSFDEGGEAEVAARSFGGLGPIIAIAVFGILGVLVIEFGRFRETAVVAGVIPLGIFGGLVALFVTGNSISYTAVIGFIALIGIEIKNSILLVDFTTQLRRQGLGLRDAIERAGEVRFLPVLLTSVTAIGGLLPLALSGSGLYGPLAWVIIGGLISSTLLSRIVTPVMYLLIVRGAAPEPA